MPAFARGDTDSEYMECFIVPVITTVVSGSCLLLTAVNPEWFEGPVLAYPGGFGILIIEK